MSDWNKKIIDEFRANKGHVGGRFENTPLLLLHTTGAKSGQTRINPVAYMADSERLVIVASKGGAPNNPDWFYNLVANPEVTLEVGSEEFRAQAMVAEEPERSQLYDRLAARNPGFDTYQKKTTRQIPVVILKPLST